MGFKVQKLDEKKPVKLYTGGLKVNVVGVNPNAKELNDFYGISSIDKDPEYVGTNSNGVPQCRVTLLVQNENLDFKNNLTYFISDETKESKTGKKLYINKYGQNAWLLPSDVAAKTIPENMEWFLIDGMREAKNGEVEFTDTLRAILGVKSLTQATKEGDITLAEGYIADINKVIQGDISEIKGYLNGETNSIGVMLGIKSSEDGKSYQFIYPNKVLLAYSNNYDYVIKDIQERQANGAMPSVDFGNFSQTPVEFSPDSIPSVTEVKSEEPNF